MNERANASRDLEPSIVRAIIEAFESAVEELRAQGRLTETARETLARTIIEHADQGLRDAAALKASALAWLNGRNPTTEASE